MSRRVALFLFLSRRAPIWHSNRAQILRRRLSNVDVTSIDIGQLRSSVLNRIDSRKDEIIRKSQTNLFDTILDNILAGNATDDDVKKAVDEMDSQSVVELATDIYSSQERAGSDVVHLAAPLFRSAAMQGNVNAKYTYAQLLRQGQGVTPDPSEAATLFSELSRGGHPYAQFALAGMYSAGLGVEKNAEKSLQLYRLSAKNGIVQAHNAIGNLYLNEIIEGKGPLDAIECFQKGIEMGDMHAHMSMAHCYNHGKGVTKDESKAFHHLQTASQSGLPVAQYNLGCQYFMGKGVDVDFAKAAACFRDAAKQEFSPALVNLGNMYYSGLGVEKNRQTAKQFYLQASVGDKNAKALYEQILKEENDD